MYMLRHSDLALGSMSGAILMALACGCPSITWGDSEQFRRYHLENICLTPFSYLCKHKPTTNTLISKSLEILHA